jgi:putative membrane protein
LAEAGSREPDVRFGLANERTLLAYQRTAIGLVAAAVAVAHFLDEGVVVLALSTLLLASSAVAAIGGYVRYRDADRAIREGRPLNRSWTPLLITLGLVLSLVVADVNVGNAVRW